jgi:hypothetical protein
MAGANTQSDKKGIVTKSMDLTPEGARVLPLYEQFQRGLRCAIGG